MLYSDLFIWWAISISWSIAFLIMVSVYLYRSSRRKAEGNRESRPTRFALIENFAFIWVLIGLLALYIISIHMGSSVLFAAGNIVVEVILIAYAATSGTRNQRKRQKPTL